MNIVIVSTKFSPGHIAHLCAYYHLSVECGFKTIFYLNKSYLKYINKDEYAVVTDFNKVADIDPDVVLIYNASVIDMRIAKFCDSYGWKLLYVWHEPYPGFRQLLKEKSYIPKFIAAHFISLYICRQADGVFFASQYAMGLCKTYIPSIYKIAIRFPLIFMDESIKNEVSHKRTFFSHVGTFSEAHGSLEFLKFVKFAAGQNIKFQIATKTDITKYLNDPILKSMKQSGQLMIQQGQPLSTHEINVAYSNSICVWNAYKRSTQSGVLPNAFMMGTPVIATYIGSFPEFVIPGVTGEFINDYRFDAILTAYNNIKININKMEENCRKEFLNLFYYRNKTKEFKKIIKKQI